VLLQEGLGIVKKGWEVVHKALPQWKHSMLMV